MKNLFQISLVVLLLASAGCNTVETTSTDSGSEAPRFIVTFPEEVRSAPVTGRVLVFLSQKPDGEPRKNLSFMKPEPVFAIDVTEVHPNAPIAFFDDDFDDPDSLAFPGPFSQLDPGAYRVQALIDIDNTRRSFNSGPGNLYSEPVDVVINRETLTTQILVANQTVKEPERKDNDWVKLVKVRSQLLSDFHKRDVYLRAAVLLPYGYADEPERKYPAYYEIPGFGGRHFGLLRFPESDRDEWKDWSSGRHPFRGFKIVLDPDMPLGHSVFANSANNGPVGDALVTELIPAIESRFRIVPAPHGRFVGGHSSGGWSSLWLQITYPGYFGGCWSTAPDPVDFRAFQTMNIYEETDGHWTPEGYPRPVARSRHEVLQSVVTENHWEYVLGYGEQLDSFDAVFSPRGTDGKPMQMTDKLTGRVNREVADYWRNYDIRMILADNWSELGPKLQGKLHIVGGAFDTYYLEDALEMLQAFLDTRDHGGYVKILTGNHGSFMNDELFYQFYREMADTFAQSSSVKR